MTKDELIEVLEDFLGDMEIQVKALQYIGDGVHDDSYEYVNCDIKSVHKCYHYKKDFLLIELE